MAREVREITCGQDDIFRGMFNWKRLHRSLNKGGLVTIIEQVGDGPILVCVATGDVCKHLVIEEVNRGK